MKKVVFFIQHMMLGGTERSLINILNNIDYNKYDVTVKVLKAKGELLNKLPSNVKVNEIEFNNDIQREILYYGTRNLIKKALKKFKIFQVLRIIFQRLFINCYKPDPNNYDIAICYYFQSSSILKHVALKVNAKDKYAFIHGDLYGNPLNYNDANKCIFYYTRIFAVSKEVVKQFIDLFPHYKEKIQVRYNIVPINDIIALSKEENPFEDDTKKHINIVTVARLSRIKGHSLALEAAGRLRDKQIDFKWYFVGDGPIKEELTALIREMELDPYIIFEGGQANPYKYINNADIYVQPSLHEGWCLTLQEARILNKPIVTTNFPTAYEQIKNEETGLIVEKDPEKIADAIIRLIEDKNLRDKFINNLKEENKRALSEDKIEF